MKTLTAMGLAVLTMSVVGHAAADGIRHVRQSVFGMDCAPCAYGVEKSLRALPGVEEVTVSLNEGYAEADLMPNSSTTLAQIREAIRNNGFTPKRAVLRIEGSYASSPRPTLHAGGRGYPLRFDGPVPKLTDGERIAVTGAVAAESDAGIVVERIEPLTPPDESSRAN